MDKLEEAVNRAMAEPGFRAEFYRVFLQSQVFVPHGNTASKLRIEDGKLAQNAQMKFPSIQADGKNWIPIFSSKENLSKAISEQTQYIQIRANDFLQIVRGAHVILNPGGWGKQFLPDEIEAMLSDPNYTGDSPRRLITTREEKILLGQPSKYPTRLVETLKESFSGIPEVRAAYLAHGFIPSFGDSPHTLIGIDTDNYDSVVAQIGPAVKSALEQSEIVDFISTRQTGTVAEYMIEATTPFYTSPSRLGAVPVNSEIYCTPPSIPTSQESQILHSPPVSPLIRRKKGFWKRVFGL